MSGKRSILAAIVVVTCVVLSGCFGGGTSPATSPIPPANCRSLLKLTVRWDGFAAVRGPARVDPSEITHVGARLEYPQWSAVVIQSVERQVAENVGVLTMEVPAAEKAHLYTVAVKYDGTWKGNRVVYLGVLRDLYIPGNTVIDIKMDDIQWESATWHVSEEDETIWNSNPRVYEAPASSQYIERPVIYVRDPFQIGQNPIYSDLLIQVMGRSSPKDNPDGWRRFDMYAENPRVGKDNTQEYEFNPYIASGKFNLPDGYYYIEPLDNTYSVHWKL